jgi:hypothetical protein
LNENPVKKKLIHPSDFSSRSVACSWNIQHSAKKDLELYLEHQHHLNANRSKKLNIIPLFCCLRLFLFFGHFSNIISYSFRMILLVIQFLAELLL